MINLAVDMAIKRNCDHLNVLIPNKALRPIADRIRPRDIAVFYGNMNMKKLNFIETWMIKNVKAPLGDFRDWEAITSWATAIADVLNNERK